MASRAYRAGGAVWTWRAERIVRPSEIFYLLIEGKQGKGKIKKLIRTVDEDYSY